MSYTLRTKSNSAAGFRTKCCWNLSKWKVNYSKIPITTTFSTSMCTLTRPWWSRKLAEGRSHNEYAPIIAAGATHTCFSHRMKVSVGNYASPISMWSGV